MKATKDKRLWRSMITDLIVDMDARRQVWARGGALAPLPGNVVKCFLCCIILRKCRQLLGASPPDLHRGSASGSRWGTSVLQTRSISLIAPWKKILRRPYACGQHAGV